MKIKWYKPKQNYFVVSFILLFLNASLINSCTPVSNKLGGTIENHGPNFTETPQLIATIQQTDKTTIITSNSLKTTPSSELSAHLIFSNQKTYLVKRILTITNGGADIIALRIWLPSITNWDSQKTLSSKPTMSIMPTQLPMETSANDISDYWEIRKNPSSNQSITMTQEYLVEVFQTELLTDNLTILPYNQSDTEYQRYTKSENLIEADAPEIINMAKNLAASEDNPYRLAKIFYEYVNNSLNYQSIEGIGGALFALEQGYGECGDYAALFVALCRTTGIPARPVIGSWAPTGDYHVWAEFYLEGIGWIPVDPTLGPKDGHNTFGKIDNQRIIFNKTFNIELEPKPHLIEPIADLFQTYYWEFEISSGDPKKVTVNLDYELTEQK